MVRNLLLRIARHEKGWTQQQLADFAEISLSTVERAERGESIRIDSIKRLCECLQKNPDQLGLLGKQNSYDKPNKEHDILGFLNNDYVSALENEMTTRWSLYHTGGTNLTYWKLNTWVQHIAKCANLFFDSCVQNAQDALNACEIYWIK